MTHDRVCLSNGATIAGEEVGRGVWCNSSGVARIIPHRGRLNGRKATPSFRAVAQGVHRLNLME